MRWFLVLYGVWGLVEVEAQSSNDDSNPSEIVYQENSISVGPSLCTIERVLFSPSLHLLLKIEYIRETPLLIRCAVSVCPDLSVGV